MSYTKQQILNECSAAMNNVHLFYNEDFLNRRDKTSDTDEYFTEVIAEFVIANLNAFKNIPQITRKGSYKTESHKGEYPSTSEGSEEAIAMDMFNQCEESPLDFIGTIIDYQTPLKNKLKDEAGKIDLLSDDKKNKQFIILELKRPDNKETMLRCVLEGYTYLRRVDKAKLLSDWKYPVNYGLSTSPLVLKGGEQWQEMQEDRPQLKKLMKMLDIIPYYYKEENGKFVVYDK